MWVSAVAQVPGFTAAELEPHAAAVCLGEVRLRDYYVGSSLVVPSGTSVPARCWALAARCAHGAEGPLAGMKRRHVRSVVHGAAGLDGQLSERFAKVRFAGAASKATDCN